MLQNLSKVSLLLVTPNHIIKVYEDELVFQASKLVRKKRIGAVPIIERGGSKVIDNISL